MKKLAILILAVIYLGTATGATVNLHYCMGEFAGMELGHSDYGSCSSCGMEKLASADDDCCKDEQKTIKLNDAHKSAQVFFELGLISPSIVHMSHVVSSFALPTITESYPLVNAPPRQTHAPVYLSTRSIRI